MSKRVSLTVSCAAVVVGGALLATQALASQGEAPDAREPASRMSLIVIEGVPGSDALLRGDYETGLSESLASLERSPNRRVAELSSNICAAQAKLGEFDSATGYCELALSAQPSLLSARQHEAIALVNRGVVQALRGERTAASADFGRAADLFTGLGVARSNFTMTQVAGRVLVDE
jgi:tetratricopeptide (TPR) repeat protein